LTGKRFHKLTVIRFEGYRHQSRRWECLCDCGKTTLAVGNELISGKRISCGCERATFGNNTTFKYNSKQAYTNTKAGALKRGYSFNITFEEFVGLLSNECYYCGHQASGLDRINNTGSYEPGNLVACCGKCNRMKGVLDQKEFLILVKRIYERKMVSPHE
jgi:hypothetical protein